jgi:type IV secretion system protein VirB9
VQSKTFYSYNPTGLYEIFCHEGYLTDIQLQPGEDIQYIGGGDTVRWTVDRATSGSGENKRWHIYVKPLADRVTTNFMITTDRRSYQIRAKATGDFYNPIVGWTYPLDEKAAFLREKEEQIRKEEEQVTQAVSPEKMNFRYKVEEKTGFWGTGGKYPWTPKMVFDDGLKTYIQMGEGMNATEAPALFVKDDAGNLMLVNYRVKKNYYIVDRLFSQAELRNGMEETVYIKRKK